MQNDTVFSAPKIGTTDAASSEVQPIASTRFEVDAYIWRTAGTASAGSPRVSTLLHARSWLVSVEPEALADDVSAATAPPATSAVAAASQATVQARRPRPVSIHARRRALRGWLDRPLCSMLSSPPLALLS